MPQHVFVTGGTGYIGRLLCVALRERGHTVRALVRAGSEGRLPSGVPFVVGSALDASTFAHAVPPADTLVHLVGTPNPSPFKAAEFERIDRRSAIEALHASSSGGVRHLVYVSVAHPAPIMRDYITIRVQVESAIQAAHASTGLSATILRPWYVLGPGRRWPNVLRPFYALARLIPSLRDDAERLGLVTHLEMVAALVTAVEHPAQDITILEVPAIRRASPPPAA